MKSQINLLQRQEVKKKNNTLLYVSCGIFSIVFLAAFGILLYLQQLKNEYIRLQAVEASAISRVNGELATKKASIIILHDRLANIQKVIDTRTDISAKVTSILGSLPSSILVDGLSATTDKISFSIASDNLADMNEVLEKSIKEIPQTQANGIKKIDLTSFGINSRSSRYTAFLVFKFK